MFVDSSAECDLYDWFPEIEEMVSGRGNHFPLGLGNLLGSQHPWFALASKFSFVAISDCVARNPSVGSGLLAFPKGGAGVHHEQCLEFKFEFAISEVSGAVVAVALTFFVAASTLEACPSEPSS